MARIELELNGLNCASCAGKIEKLTQEIDGVTTANLDFINKKIKVEIDNENNKEKIKDTIVKIVDRLEPDVKVLDLSISKDDHNHTHGHSHEHGNVDTNDLIRILLALVLFIVPPIFKLEGSTRLAIYLVSYFIVGYDVIIRAGKNIANRTPFDENFLMTLATIGAFIIGEYPEGVAVMLFYQVGELFQDMAVNHSRKSIKALTDIMPDYANLERENEIVGVNPGEVNIGDFIIIKPGEKVPLDGVVIEGESSLDTSNITGESVPRSVKVGDNIFSGAINNQGLLRVKVEKEFEESTVSKILDLVENASSKKAPTEKFITKFARYYTPAVVFIALGIGIIPTLFFGEDLSEWAYRAFVFLVISCPCALVISIPLGFFGGIGAASKQGVLIKGGNYLEALNDVNTLVFDKTGTITKGVFKVTDIKAYADYTNDEILELAAYGENYSNHPIALSILSEYHKEIHKEYIKDYEEIPGKGISVNIDNVSLLLGNKDLLEENNISVVEQDSIGTVVYIAKEGKHIGTIIVSDEIKDNIRDDISKLKDIGIKETIMLSGDNNKTANKVGDIVGIDKVYGNLLPQDKVHRFEEILKRNHGNKKVAFVGDGVNDAPVLARADVGIAMGGLGSDAAIEASDIVILTDEISKISTGIKIAKKTKRIVTQNIILAIGLKLVVLGLGAFGLASMWQAVFADVGVSIIAILNSIRVLKVEE
ncbi:MAG: heavy metal translocating P-type ATPase [Tissierellaceae bacterium]|nr:heavy metal translocating P-type ATPase [Tissierellaceae bacterium]